MNKSSEDMTIFQQLKELCARIFVPVLLLVLGFWVAPKIAHYQESRVVLENKRLKQMLDNSVELLIEGKDSVQVKLIKQKILIKN